jgi:hypothetical protein
VDLSTVDLSPMDLTCIRCQTAVQMRFYGLCPACRDELDVKYDGVGSVIEIDEYVPKVNVTANAVALKDD